MKFYKELYKKIYSLDNLYLAWKKARKGKTKKEYVKEFESNLLENLRLLSEELIDEEYFPKPLKKFIIRDPKTRKISKSEFRDRIIHHALCNLIEPILQKSFILDSCANQVGKGTLFAIKRFEKFINKNVSFCLKGDIKKYFESVDRKILINILSKKIKCSKTINLIKNILNNFEGNKGIPLGNLTSQFFANVYLNELDKFVKHKLKAEYYIRYVDDFVILHKSRKQLEDWKEKINCFLKSELKLELHQDKTRIIFLKKGIDFVGFRIFPKYKLLRKRNIKSMKNKIQRYKNHQTSKEKIIESFQGWNAYAKWANSFYLRRRLLRKINLTK